MRREQRILGAWRRMQSNVGSELQQLQTERGGCSCCDAERECKLPENVDIELYRVTEGNIRRQIMTFGVAETQQARGGMEEPNQK